MSCKDGKQKCMQAQKVVIPKGMINPEETTVIEIPARLHKQPIVVAKRKCCGGGAESCDVAAECRNRAGININHSHSFDPAFHSTGIPQNTCSHPPPNCSAFFEESAGGLGQTEAAERMELQRDLEDFQKARRKLLASASRVASQDPPGTESFSSSFDPHCCKRKPKTKLDPEFDKEEYSRTLYDTLDL